MSDQERQPRPKRRDISGWVVLDKGVGMTSTHAVAAVKRALNAKKAGHAGTLDPLASGILPIALGEATKTVPYVMDGRKAYVFTVAWGAETNTDDAEGEVVASSEIVPTREAIEALLPRFTGAIEQTPPRFSAIKIGGERAYDLAREGETVELKARPVEVHRLAVVSHEGTRSVLEAECGKGTYVRSLARDLGRALGCLGHVAALRRTRVGPFTEAEAVTVAALGERRGRPASRGDGARRAAVRDDLARRRLAAHARPTRDPARPRGADCGAHLRHLRRRAGGGGRRGTRRARAPPGVPSRRLTSLVIPAEPKARAGTARA